MLLHDAERLKREKLRFCTMQKGQKEKKHVSERLRTIKKKNYVEESGLLSAKREGRYVEKRLSKVLAKFNVI